MRDSRNEDDRRRAELNIGANVSLAEGLRHIAKAMGDRSLATLVSKYADQVQKLEDEIQFHKSGGYLGT